MNNEIKVVLFDLGRVLMHIDFDAFPNGLGLFTEEQRAPYQIPTAKLWRAYETGKMTTDDFLESLYNIFDYKFSKRQILEAWNGIIVRDNEKIVPFVQEVQKKYRTAILSNTSPSHWEKVLHISLLVRSIPHHFTSFGIGAMKPDPMVYHHVADSLLVQPHEILFIDDLQENVKGAVTVGMKGIVYKGIDSLHGENLHI
ncbi:MAG: HAD family phosphatase [Ignavibacteriales bacterium]|nr:HAD family phosphatase [Ignavibacteriales bacterium]